MKTISFKLILLFISFSCICGMCSKNDAPVNNPPGELKNNTGFLTTMAPGSDGQLDSACIRMGAYWLTSFSEAAITGGFVDRAEDTWQVANDGSGHWYFKNKEKGAYLKISNPITGGYNAGTSIQLSDSTKFIINKDDKDRFYIESALHRGNYLITMEGPTPPKHRSVDFKTTPKQLWYIRP